MTDAKRITKREIVDSLVESRIKKTPELRLRERDYGIMGFILEQKFASLEMIYLRHFEASKRSEGVPESFRTARQRLARLRDAGLLKVEKVPAEGKGLFLLTRLGLRTLEERHGRGFPVREAKRIDFSLYDHDRRIGMIRATLESRGRCRRWWSEKILRAAAIPIVEGGRRFDRELIPDAVFLNSKGERIALELEVSRKGYRKTWDKVSRYWYDYLTKGVLDKVWVVVTKPAIGRAYRRAIGGIGGPHASRFRVDPYGKVVPSDGD